MKKYNINDRIMYMSKKIYRISKIEVKNFGNDDKEYYVLVDDKVDNDILYLPLDNDLALKNIRHLLTKKEIDKAIIDSLDIEFLWNNSYKERIQIYNDLLKENNMSKLLSAVRTILARKKDFEKIKKSLPSIDLNFLNGILQVIDEEFAYVLNIKEDDVVNYITNKKKDYVL